MKILSAQQVRELDEYTIKHSAISAFQLMHRAATKCLERYKQLLPHPHPVVFVCGKGNNGGDGLAIALLLAKEGVATTVLVLEHKEVGSPEFEQNRKLVLREKNIRILHINSIEQWPTISADAVLVDAILGNGISRPLSGLLAAAVKHINKLKNKVLSIDVPSGLFADDNSSNNLATVVSAHWTFTIHAPKLCLLLPDTGILAGHVHVIDIGLMEDDMAPTSSYIFSTLAVNQAWYRPRQKFSHKGTFGHALLVSGSLGKMGAAQLAAEAALRAGAGLLTVHVPECGVDIMQVGVKEAMCSVDECYDVIGGKIDPSGFNAIAVGPGIGTERATKHMLKRMLKKMDTRCVIDADALNILSQRKSNLALFPSEAILTPHPKEFERLVGPWNSSLERLQLQIEFSKKYKVYIVLKGANSSVSTPLGKVYFNASGNAGMATAGSGDVLTGIILGLLAQGYSPESAAVMGTFVHGKAGDWALKNSSEEAVLARDILQCIGKSFAELAT